VIRAAIAGLGWWGKTIIESAAGTQLDFVALTTRSNNQDTRDFAQANGIRVAADLDELLADDAIDAIVLATPHSQHTEQVIAAAKAGKHVFVEKPFALTKADAEAAIAAVDAAGVTIGLDYGRRFHPEMTRLREQIRSGELGTILHVEATMTGPNGLALAPGAWRADREETPVGGLTPMGVHAIDGMIDLCGPIETVVCQSFRRAISVDADDTSTMLFRMREGMSGYLGVMMATGPGFSFQVFGSAGWVRLEGKPHVVGASSEERRMELCGRCTAQPVKGELRVWQAERFDVTRAALEAFTAAVQGDDPYPITREEMIHGAAVTEAVVHAAASGAVETVA
jgi:predicted dehydrogenase